MPHTVLQSDAILMALGIKIMSLIQLKIKYYVILFYAAKHSKTWNFPKRSKSHSYDATPCMWFSFTLCSCFWLHCVECLFCACLHVVFMFIDIFIVTLSAWVTITLHAKLIFRTIYYLDVIFRSRIHLQSLFANNSCRVAIWPKLFQKQTPIWLASNLVYATSSDQSICSLKCSNRLMYIMARPNGSRHKR